jgi:D-methionine transport system permease protein
MEGGKLMFSEMFYKLLEKNLIQLGIWETIYMTLLSSLIAYVIGLPLGIILSITDQNGICPNSFVNRVLGFIVNFFRSIPFIVLMVAMLPVAKFILGTSLGNGAVIVMLVIAAAPYVGRMVESSIKEVSSGVIEAAQSMGCTNFQIITRVLLPEAKPALIHGAVISMVTILGYSAMAGTIGGTGLGQIAITYGYQRYQDQIVWLCVFLMVIIVQIIQEFGMWLARALDKRNNDSGKNAPVSTVQQEYNQQ